MGYDNQFFLDLFYTDTQAPYDLTGAIEIVAAFPGADGTPVEQKLSTAGVQIIGAPGAGRVLVKVDAVNSALLQQDAAVEQFQDLQVSVTNPDSTVTGLVIQAVLNIRKPPYGVV
jgi:hypothetical protein